MERMRRRRMSRLAAAAVALVVAAGCGLGGNGADDRTVDVAATEPAPVATTADTEPAPAQTTAAPSKTPAKKPTRKPTKKTTKKPGTEAAADQNWGQVPACATFEGTAVSKKKAKAALTAAASRVYWKTEAPELRVPARLIKAVAWQESGWTSNIVNCDGGFGLMQAMPDTVAHINQRFGLSYDVKNYKDNAYVGANYLAWLTRKFGVNYFKGSYDLSPRKCRSHSDTCLLNMVIAAYNAGDGGVEQSYPDGRLPNPGYVDSVRSLMKKCYCDRY